MKPYKISTEEIGQNVRKAIEKKYDQGVSISSLKRSFIRTNYAKYEIHFWNKSIKPLVVIMSYRQRLGIMRSKYWHYIESVGGLGYVELK